MPYAIIWGGRPPIIIKCCKEDGIKRKHLPWPPRCGKNENEMVSKDRLHD